MQLIRHRAGFAVVAAMLCSLPIGGCDSNDEASVMDVAGGWTSETFQNRDLGQAVLELTFAQEGEQLEGTGVLRLPQAGSDLTFTLDGTARSQSVQFRILYATAVPENVNCTRESDTRLKCTKSTDRFNLDRNEE